MCILEYILVLLIYDDVGRIHVILYQHSLCCCVMSSLQNVYLFRRSFFFFLYIFSRFSKQMDRSNTYIMAVPQSTPTSLPYTSTLPLVGVATNTFHQDTTVKRAVGWHHARLHRLRNERPRRILYTTNRFTKKKRNNIYTFRRCYTSFTFLHITKLVN